mgnify:CR=1 FL=1
MRVLVTGANGHIGSNVVRQALEEGIDVVPFVRKTSDTRAIDPLGLDYAYGDVRNAESLVDAAMGCDAIIHTAAVYKNWARDPDDIIEPAVEGTKNIFIAASEAGVDRIVYTSSANSVGVNEEPEPLGEEQWADEYDFPYGRAKKMAEEHAHELAEKTGIDVVVLCPGAVLGAYDYKITPTTTVARDLVTGDQPVMGGGVCITDVRDVARAHVVSLTDAKPGERYLICGTNMSYEEIGQKLEEMFDLDLMRLNLPKAVLSTVGFFSEIGARITGNQPQLTRALAKDIVGKFMFYENDKMREELGIEPRPADEVLERTMQWLLHMDEVEPPSERVAEEYAPEPHWPDPAG